MGAHTTQLACSLQAALLLSARLYGGTGATLSMQRTNFSHHCLPTPTDMIVFSSIASALATGFF